MNRIINALTQTSNAHILFISALLCIGIMSIIFVVLFLNLKDKRLKIPTLIPSLILLIVTFLMGAYIALSVTQITNHSNVVEGEVINYHQKGHQSQLTLKQNSGKPVKYEVEGIANNFVYKNGDYIHGSESENILYNVQKINGKTFDPPFAKYHAVLIMLGLTFIVTVGFLVITLYFNQKHLSAYARFTIELVSIAFSAYTIAIGILFFVLIMFLSSTDTRTFNVQGRVVDSTTRLDSTKTYTLEEDDSHIRYVINDQKERHGHIKVKIRKPSHDVVQYLGKVDD